MSLLEIIHGERRAWRQAADHFDYKLVDFCLLVHLHYGSLLSIQG